MIYRPDKGGEFPSDRGSHYGGAFALSGKIAEPATKPCLRFPRDLADGSRRRFDLCLLFFADAGWEPIAPSRFYQKAPRSSVPGLGDSAAVDPLAG